MPSSNLTYQQNSSIFGPNMSSSGIHDTSSSCKTDYNSTLDTSQNVTLVDKIQLTRRLESLRDRQLQLMSKIESLKIKYSKIDCIGDESCTKILTFFTYIYFLQKARMILMQHMQQLYNTQKMKSRNESVNQAIDSQICFEHDKNISHHFTDNTSDLHTFSCLSNVTKYSSDISQVNLAKGKSFVDRECQTNFSSESMEKLCSDKLNNENSVSINLSSITRHNSLPVYSNIDCCNYANSAMSSNASNVSALAMVAAMTAATIFKRTFQQSMCQVNNTNSESLCKFDYEQRNDSAFNSSVLPAELSYSSDLQKLTSTKKDNSNEVFQDDCQLCEHLPFSQSNYVINVTEQIPPPPPAPSSSLYCFDNINQYPSVVFSDTSCELNSSLLHLDTSNGKLVTNALKPGNIQEVRKSTKIPEIISSKTFESEPNKDKRGIDSTSKGSYDNNDIYRYSQMATSSRTRDRFSDRILQARQAIDSWTFQKQCGINNNVNQLQNSIDEMTKQFNISNDNVASDKSYSQPMPFVNNLGFCKECSLAPFTPSPLTSSGTNSSNECSVVCNDSIPTKYIYKGSGHFQSTFTKGQSTPSKAMPIQIVKPAVRNQHVHNSTANNSINEGLLKTENEVTDNQMHHISHSQKQEDHAVPNYKDQKGVSDKKHIKSVLISESKKSERSNKTNRNPSAQRSVAWVDEVSSHPLSDSIKHSSATHNSPSQNNKSTNSMNTYREGFDKNCSQNSLKNVTTTKRIETNQPIKTITSTAVATVPRRLLPVPNNNAMNSN
ncbi:dentin phosphoryn [Schistosoma japonicum]|nr:dentin phosphoryn [Schistosoma japonicum]